MASPAPKPSSSASTATSKPPLPHLSLPPTSLLQTQAAQTFTHIHPLLILSAFTLRFNALVADPVPTLTSSLIPLTIIQLAYITTCLPPAGPSSAPAAPMPASKKPQRRKPNPTAEKGRAQNIIPAVLALFLSLAIGTPILYVLLVLHGAPLTTHGPHTALLAAHISLLAGLPLCYTRGVDKQAWWAVIGAGLPFDESWGAAVGTVFGAWLGAVPIPLDWDREWQKWPVTILTGAYLGCVIGKLAGGYLFYGKVIPMEEHSLDED